MTIDEIIVRVLELEHEEKKRRIVTILACVLMGVFILANIVGLIWLYVYVRGNQ